MSPRVPSISPSSAGSRQVANIGLRCCTGGLWSFLMGPRKKKILDCFSVCLYLRLHAFVCICLYICLSVCLSIGMFARLPISLFPRMFIGNSLYLTVRLLKQCIDDLIVPITAIINLSNSINAKGGGST